MGDGDHGEVFGVPVVLEDHAIRACCRSRPVKLAVDVQARDGVELRLRVGLNSGQVIAGDNRFGRLHRRR